MKKIKSLSSIKNFVENESKKNFPDFNKNLKINRVKKTLEKISKSEEKKITFTVGELNAYLG